MLVHYMSHENIIAILSVLISAIVSFLSDAVWKRPGVSVLCMGGMEIRNKDVVANGDE